MSTLVLRSSDPRAQSSGTSSTTQTSAQAPAQQSAAQQTSASDGFSQTPQPSLALQGQSSVAVDSSSGLPTGLLRRGDHSSAVEQLQHALIKLHVMTSAQVATGPGWFGPRTQHALETFQKAHHLNVTGEYDAPTRAAMGKALGHPSTRTTTPAPAPAAPAAPAAPSLTRVPRGEAAQYQFFKRFVAAHGGKFLTGPNRMNIVGLRKNDRVGRGAGSYRDVAYVVYTDSKGRPHSKRFTYNTEPAQSMSWYGTDVDHNGSKDLGRIPNGYYSYAIGRRTSGAHCLKPVTHFTTERDVNHDGRFSEHVRKGDGDAMFFHQAGYNGTGSAGCQTLPPGEWSRFWGLVKNARGHLGYTLTTTVPAGA